MLKLTQQEKVLDVLRKAQGKPVSARYMKQTMLISETNARISELRNKGYDIETSKKRDDYGFAYHRLLPENDIEFNIKTDLDWFESIK